MQVWSGTQFPFKLASGLYLNLPDSKAFVGIFIHFHFLFFWLVIDRIKGVLEWRATCVRMALR